MTIHDPDAETDEWITHPPPSPASTLTDQQMLNELARRGTLSIVHGSIGGREFSGVLSRASADSFAPQPDSDTVTLDREGLTEPGILRLAANDLRRNYHLGIYGLPRSLPATLDALADAMEGDR